MLLWIARSFPSPSKRHVDVPCFNSTIFLVSFLCSYPHTLCSLHGEEVKVAVTSHALHLLGLWACCAPIMLLFPMVVSHFALSADKPQGSFQGPSLLNLQRPSPSPPVESTFPNFMPYFCLVCCSTYHYTWQILGLCLSRLVLSIRTFCSEVKLHIMVANSPMWLLNAWNVAHANWGTEI